MESGDKEAQHTATTPTVPGKQPGGPVATHMQTTQSKTQTKVTKTSLGLDSLSLSLSLPNVSLFLAQTNA